MKKHYLAVAVAAAFAAQGVAHAQDYQMEAGVSYADDSNDSEIGLDFTYHIEMVKTADRPLAEAAFLGRNSNVSAFYVNPDDSNFEDTLGLGVEWWFEDIYVAAAFSDTDGDNELGLQVGYMLDDGFLVYAGFSDSDSMDVSGISLGTKYVANSINLEAEVVRYDDDSDTTQFMVAGDYYINNNFSVGATVDKFERFAATYGLRSRYFFTPVLSAEVGYDKTEGVEDELISARVAYRF